MSLLPYCVFLPSDTELPQDGVWDRLVRTLKSSGLAAIYSKLERKEISGDRFQAAALKFHDVVHAVFKRQAVVPFRFPTILDEADLRKHLQQNSSSYLSFLHKHGDDVQMEVRLWIPETLPRNVSSGTEYMLRSVNRLTHLKSASQYIQHISEDIVDEWKSDDSRDAMRLYARVARSRIDDFRDRFTRRPHPANVAMRLTGPWPATQFFPGSASGMPHNGLSIARGEKS